MHFFMNALLHYDKGLPGIAPAPPIIILHPGKIIPHPGGKLPSTFLRLILERTPGTDYPGIHAPMY
jgi:hypothetical protein